MFTRILNLVQTNKPPLRPRPACQSTFGLLNLAFATAFIYGECKFCIDELEAKLATFVRFFKRVHGAELEVHGIGVRKVFEEGEQLDDVVLFDDLKTESVGCPLLVNGNDHSSAGD